MDPVREAGGLLLIVLGLLAGHATEVHAAAVEAAASTNRVWTPLAPDLVSVPAIAPQGLLTCGDTVVVRVMGPGPGCRKALGRMIADGPGRWTNRLGPGNTGVNSRLPDDGTASIFCWHDGAWRGADSALGPWDVAVDGDRLVQVRPTVQDGNGDGGWIATVFAPDGRIISQAPLSPPQPSRLVSFGTALARTDDGVLHALAGISDVAVPRCVWMASKSQDHAASLVAG